MLNTITQLKIGTRSSKLALKQTKLVVKKLENLPQIRKKFFFKIIKVKTKGDIHKSKILDSGYKGFFTKKIDDLLLKKKLILRFILQKTFLLRLVIIFQLLLF